MCDEEVRALMLQFGLVHPYVLLQNLQPLMFIFMIAN